MKTDSEKNIKSVTAWGGFGDTRGTLFFDIARILHTKRPRLFLLENVKGLLSHDGGATIKTIISTLTELGYDTQWQVLNSKDFGVPQNRERVYIVGHLRETPRSQVFPIGESNTKTLEQLNHPKHSNDRVYGIDGISPTLNTMQGGNRQPFIYDLKATENSTRRGKVSNKGYAKTLDRDCLQAVEDGIKIRRLTPLECERLQAYPDGWTRYGRIGIMKEKDIGKPYPQYDDVIEMSDTQRYKTLGNGVTTKVVQAIMERLLINQQS